jgi:hypothetical protein
MYYHSISISKNKTLKNKRPADQVIATLNTTSSFHQTTILHSARHKTRVEYRPSRLHSYFPFPSHLKVANAIYQYHIIPIPTHSVSSLQKKTGREIPNPKFHLASIQHTEGPSRSPPKKKKSKAKKKRFFFSFVVADIAKKKEVR